MSFSNVTLSELGSRLFGGHRYGGSIDEARVQRFVVVLARLVPASNQV
jgi:hypothetical protein